ncbi:hypothetical protein I6H91_08765 [Micrococcus luteus]|uniref:DUF6578 domain-containing protein n=1 Tax=Micrococcus luteus TaxID=1270 RepID=UPI00190FEC1B|nr:DUF6578 domain-containing protein [Micrococcus luteus]QQE48233.1 hypothetical protein I6H91_08765 [Micrococcus luteus]
MEITAGRRSRAYVADGEQECCGERILVGEIVDMVLLPFSDEDQDPALGPVDWITTHHDDGDPSRRVSARLQRVQQIHSRRWGASGNAVEGVEWEHGPGAAQLVEIDRLPSGADMFSQVSEEPSAAGRSFLPLAPGAPTFSDQARYSPALPEPPGPDGWLLDLDILADLGPQA